MEGYRELLHKKASKCLPTWPKGPNDIYVAILPHGIHVRSCEWKDFLWLKVKGKNTVAQVRTAHNKRIGANTLLVDGTEVAKDDVQIRSLKPFRSEVVVFWTINDEGGRVPLKTVSASGQNLRKQGNANLENGAKIYPVKAISARPRNTSAGPFSVIPNLDAQAEHLKKCLKELQLKHNPPPLFISTPRIMSFNKLQCLDCPNWSWVMMDHSVDTAICQAKLHLESNIHGHAAAPYLAPDLIYQLDKKYPSWLTHVAGVYEAHEKYKMNCSECRSVFQAIIHGKYTESELRDAIKHPRMHTLVPALTAQIRRLPSYQDSQLSVEFANEVPKITCSDCPQWSIACENGHYSSSYATKVVAVVQAHLQSQEHDYHRVRSRNGTHVTAKTTQSRKRSTPRSSLEELLAKMRREHPGHKFKIHEVPRSLELKVQCAGCPSFSYDNFLNDGLTFAETELEIHLDMNHKQESPKPVQLQPRPQEQRKPTGKFGAWYNQGLADIRGRFPNDKVEIGFIDSQLDRNHLHFKCLECHQSLGAGCTFYHMRQHMVSAPHRRRVEMRSGTAGLLSRGVGTGR